MRGVSTNYEGTTDPYSRHPSGKRQRYLLCNQKVNDLLCPLVVTDFVARVHYVLFSFGDVTVIDIRRLYLLKLIFGTGRHFNAVYESEQVLPCKTAVLRKCHTKVGADTLK